MLPDRVSNPGPLMTLNNIIQVSYVHCPGINFLLRYGLDIVLVSISFSCMLLQKIKLAGMVNVAVFLL